MVPIRHPEMVAGRRPLPKAAVGGVVQSVQVQQIAAVQVVLPRREHQIFRRGAPAQAVIAFEPHARPPVQLGDRAGDLAFDQVRAAARRVVPRRGVPADRAEIIAELDGIRSPAALVTAVDLAATPMPLEDRDEVAFLSQLHFHVHEVQAVLDRSRTDVLEHGRQGFEHVVTLPLAKRRCQVVRPNPVADAELQFIVKEVVQARRRLAGGMILKRLEKLLDHPLARLRMDRV